MTDLIAEARELIEALHAGVYDDEYVGTGAYLMLDELCDALEKAEEQNKLLVSELCKLACESLERDRALARLEAEVMAAIDAVPVVRCGECGHYNTTGCSKGFGWCESMDRGVSDDFYCANGAKMEGVLDR